MTEAPLAAPEQLATWRAGDPALLVPAAEAAVRGYCRWHIAPVRADVSVTVDGSGGQILPLPTLHLTGVTSVSEVDSTGTAVAVDLADVQWSQSGYLWRGTPWTSRLRGITATITHGYAEVPAEVQAVVLDLAQHLANSIGGATRQQAGPFSVAVAEQSMTELHRLVLERYRIPATP